MASSLPRTQPRRYEPRPAPGRSRSRISPQQSTLWLTLKTRARAHGSSRWSAVRMFRISTLHSTRRSLSGAPGSSRGRCRHRAQPSRRQRCRGGWSRGGPRCSIRCTSSSVRDLRLESWNTGSSQEAVHPRGLSERALLQLRRQRLSVQVLPSKVGRAATLRTWNPPTQKQQAVRTAHTRTMRARRVPILRRT